MTVRILPVGLKDRDGIGAALAPYAGAADEATQSHGEAQSGAFGPGGWSGHDG